MILKGQNIRKVSVISRNSVEQDFLKRNSGINYLFIKLELLVSQYFVCIIT